MRSRLSVAPSHGPDRETHALHARLLELERERSAASDRAALLLGLQDAFVKIAVTRTPDEVIAQLLRAAYEALGFSRGIYFSVDRERGIEARWQIDGTDTVEKSDEAPDVRPGSALLGVIRGDVAQGVGEAGELSAPLVDVRGWYVLCPLLHAERTIGVLYLDGHRRARVPREWEIQLAGALATIASVAIANSILFARTHELATRDALTGLFNRRAFGDRLQAEIEACRTYGRALTYVLIDVDDFKKINDTRGHAYGDRVLKKLADTLIHSSRADDVAGRYAGDEFVMMLVHVDAELARALVARLSKELRAQGVSCSLGAALFPRDASDAAGLLHAADRALYVTKAAGKNGFSFA